MSSVLEIFFPLCASGLIRWQRRTPDVEHGIWPDVAGEHLQQWLQTDAIRLYILANGSASGRLNCLMSPQADTNYSARLTGRRAEPGYRRTAFCRVENRPATGNRGSDSPAAYAQHCAVVADKRHYPRHRCTGLDVHSLWIYGWRCTANYLPHR